MAAAISTERLILRQPEPGDWKAFRDFAMSDRAGTLGGPHDLGRAWRIFAGELGHWVIRGYGMWAVTLRDGDGQPLAFIGPWVPEDWPEKEVGWMVLDARAEGTGIAFEAARAAVDHAFEVLGWDTVVSYIAAENSRSIALAERLGAKVDPAAPQPRPEEPCLIYRHPGPEDRA